MAGSHQALLGAEKNDNGSVDYATMVGTKESQSDGIMHDDVEQVMDTPSGEPRDTVAQRLKSVLKRIFNVRFLNLLLLGLSFMFIFAAYNITQGLMTLNHGKWGSISLGVLYGVFSFSSFMTPFIEMVVGAKIGLLLGVIPYAAFVLISGFTIEWLLVTSAVFLGFGAAMLWTAHGSYLSKCAGDEMGFYSGVFFAIFQFNGIIGSAITGMMKSFHLAQWIIFTVLFSIAIVGGIMMLFLRNMRGKKYEESKTTTTTLQSETEKIANASSDSIVEITEEPEEKLSAEKRLAALGGQLVKSIKSTVLVMLDKKTLLLMATYMFSGYSISFFMGRMPPVIGDDWAVWTLAIFSLAESVGSVVFGKLIDLLGKRIMALVTFATHAAALVSTFYVDAFAPYSYFVSMLICGLADSGLNTSIYSVIDGYFSTKNTIGKSKTAEAFSAFKFVQSLSSAAGFASGLLLTYWWTQMVLIVMFVAAVVTFLILDLIISPVDKKELQKGIVVESQRK